MRSYATARGQIQSGDVLGIRGRGLFAAITRLAQRVAGLGEHAGITHCGIAWWVEGRLYSVEMDGRHNVLRPVSQHLASGCAVAVYRLPEHVQHFVRVNFDRATFTPIQYGILDLAKIGLRLVFGKKTGGDDDRDMVCSTFVARWLQWSMWIAPEGFPAMPSPGELAQALGEPVLTVEKQATR